MRGRSPPGLSPPPRRSHGGGSRRRSPSPRGGRGGYGRDETEPSSLLVRNIPRDCSAEDLRIPFERYGVVKDVYLPKDYYTGQPRGFGFVQFLEPRDAAEAQYCLDHQLISGREITVVFAEENRKKPQEMRTKERVRGRPGFGGGGRRGSRSSYARSRSRSPRRFSPSPRGGRRSRSLTPPVRSTRTPSPGRHGNALSRSPSPVRSDRRRTRERSPVAPPRSRRDGSPRRSRDIEPRGRDVDPRGRDVEPRANGRDGPAARSLSRTPAGLPATPPRRQRSPSPPPRRASPAGHRKQSRDDPRDAEASGASPVVEHRRARPPGGFDQAPRSPMSP